MTPPDSLDDLARTISESGVWAPTESLGSVLHAEVLTVLRQAVSAEREACAQLVESQLQAYADHPMSDLRIGDLADSIRARGEP